MKLISIFLVALFTSLPGLATTVKNNSFKFDCSATNTTDSEPQTAYLSGPLRDHDFRIRFFDIENEQTHTGRCYLLPKAEVVCYDKDQYGNDAQQVLNISFLNMDSFPLKRPPSDFTMVSDDGDSDYSIVWKCIKR